MTAPEAGGTYILLVEFPARTTIDVGKLGPLDFEPGIYAYVGSAHGPGGLFARLGRYFAGPKRTHWHIDYLLEHAKVEGALFRVERDRLECDWAEWLRAMARAPVPGIGSSDCRCSSHLFFVGDAREAEEIIRVAGCQLQATHSAEGDDGL
jgi:sugar fermentation stimulation protein A